MDRIDSVEQVHLELPCCAEHGEYRLTEAQVHEGKNIVYCYQHGRAWYVLVDTNDLGVVSSLEFFDVEDRKAKGRKLLME